ncbi:hypothetical protein QZH41_020411, partial [Actinostola sp. cb2023]
METAPLITISAIGRTPTLETSLIGREIKDRQAVLLQALILTLARTEKILIVARVGSGYRGDIAFDEISFVPGTCFADENAEELLLRRLGGPNNSTETKGSCDFDIDNCGWAQDILDDQFDWSIGSDSGTPTEGTGPKRHHGPKVGGKFLFIESSSPRRRDDKARLLSPQLCGQVCMRFYYHMYGNRIGKLSIFRKDGINKEDDRLWHRKGNLGNKWHRAIVEMNSDQDCYQVVFEATTGPSYQSDLAIDDIYIQKGSCCDMKSELNTLDQTGNCNFGNNHFCAWKNLQIDDFDWSLGKGPTPSQFTGPKRGYGHQDGYAFIEASEPRFIGDTAIMTSGVLLGSMCMQFRYHMHGEEIGSLSIFRNGDGVMQQLLWQQDGNQGDRWHDAEFLIDCNVTAYQVEIEATVGGWRGDIAIDEIEFTPGSCPPKPIIMINYNYTGPLAKAPPMLPEFNGFCSFAKSFCAWKNDIEEDFFDWTRYEGKSPTDCTGPKFDYTGEGYYLYTEASIRRPGEFARLVSGALQDHHCLKFQYHMHGDGIGDLRVEVKDSENGYLWNTSWSVSGEQGEFWHTATVTVNGYDYVIGISAVRGSSYLGDIAIDGIQLYKGGCDGNKTLGFSVDAGRKFDLDNCNFHGKRKCQWKDDMENGQFKWTLRSGSTPSSGTGPSKDSSNGGDVSLIETSDSKRFYAFIETSSPRVLGDKARMYLKVEFDVCMRFHYHMHGQHVGELRILTRNANKVEDVVWSKQEKQGDAWHVAAKNIKGGPGIQ